MVALDSDNVNNDNYDPKRKIPAVSLFKVSPQFEALDSSIDRRSSYYREKALELHLDVRQRSKLLTLPTLLTLMRLILVPILFCSWFGRLGIQGNTPQLPMMTTAAIFIIASVTDWLDGFLARRMGLATAFGAFIDPVADKIMVSTTLVLLSVQPPDPISQLAMSVPATIIIAREITMSSLREWAAGCDSKDAHKNLKVSSLGKWKTALQMTSISLLLLLRNTHIFGVSVIAIEWHHWCSIFSWVLLIVSTALAIISLLHYMSNVWHHFLEEVQK